MESLNEELKDRIWRGAVSNPEYFFIVSTIYTTTPRPQLLMEEVEVTQSYWFFPLATALLTGFLTGSNTICIYRTHDGRPMLKVISYRKLLKLPDCFLFLFFRRKTKELNFILFIGRICSHSPRMKNPQKGWRRRRSIKFLRLLEFHNLKATTEKHLK